MKNRYSHSQEDAEINITPMLDVVFIMLIFFIVTTSFNKETGLRIFKSNHTNIQSNKVKIASIKLDINNVYSVNGIATTIDGIESLLANIKSSNPGLKAQVFASTEVKTGDLIQAIHQIKANGIDQYSVSSF